MNAFSAFLDARKSRNFALPTINRDIYGLNRFSEYLSMLKADSFGDIFVRGSRYYGGEPNCRLSETKFQKIGLWFPEQSARRKLVFDNFIWQ